MEVLDAEFWNNRYLEGSHRWDLGEVSPPLKAYIDELTDKDLKILIPGGGNSYEAEYLFGKGFTNVFVVDLAEEPLKNILTRVPSFPKDQLIQGDFFELNDTFDLVLEQTFFCALYPNLRPAYAAKMEQLIKPNGMLVGLLFNAELHKDHPPFGGAKKEYQALFKNHFEIVSMEPCTNSHETRMGRELFVVFKNKR